MDYEKTYNKLIASAKAQHIDGYYETHHIVPKAEGGSDDKTNLVKLTARQHYIAHLLLAKIYDDCAMHCAIAIMMSKTKKMHRNFRFNSRLYEKLKLKRSEFMSKKLKGKKRSEEFKQHMREVMKGKNKGRIPWNKGKTQPDEVKAKLRKANLGKKRSRESIEKFRRSMTGHIVSDETKQKLSMANKGRKMSDESRHKMSLSHLGKSPSNKGKKASLELRQKLSEAHKGQKHSEHQKQKIREAISKLQWWNNGLENRRCVVQPGPEWRRGRLKKKRSSEN